MAFTWLILLLIGQFGYGHDFDSGFWLLLIPMILQDWWDAHR